MVHCARTVTWYLTPAGGCMKCTKVFARIVIGILGLCAVADAGTLYLPLQRYQIAQVGSMDHSGYYSPDTLGGFGRASAQNTGYEVHLKPTDADLFALNGKIVTSVSLSLTIPSGNVFSVETMYLSAQDKISNVN